MRKRHIKKKKRERDFTTRSSTDFLEKQDLSCWKFARKGSLEITWRQSVYLFVGSMLLNVYYYQTEESQRVCNVCIFLNPSDLLACPVGKVIRFNPITLVIVNLSKMKTHTHTHTY